VPSALLLLRYRFLDDVATLRAVVVTSAVAANRISTYLDPSFRASESENIAGSYQTLEIAGIDIFYGVVMGHDWNLHCGSPDAEDNGRKSL
jgi:hypothetical protein